MGIDVPGFRFIIENKQHIKGDVLHIGRQGLHYAGEWADKTGARDAVSNIILRNNGLNFTAAETVIGGDGHTEKLYMMLGAKSVESIDYSAYENATHVHDLNQPVPVELHNKYDYILDAGTMEHIFDIKTVVDNYKNMLRLNGVIVFISPCNNFLGHGFYQFSPEFFRTVFSRDAGYQTVDSKLIELKSDLSSTFYNLPEPPKGQRQEFPTNNNGYYIGFATKKVRETSTENYQQSDYVAIWSHYK